MEAQPKLKQDYLAAALLFLAVVLAYLPAWWAGYIWDDDTVVMANPVVVGASGFGQIWTTSAADICPFTLTTFRLEHALWGVSPLAYHLVNVFFHGACAVVLWRVLRILQVPGAWFGAALWALHPVNVESVAWISEQKNTESGLFYLLSILFFLKGLRAPEKGITNNALTVFFAALAITSKTSTVVLPVILCLCALQVEERWHWRNVVKVGPILLLSIAAGIITIWTQHARGADDPLWARTWPERVVTAGIDVWFYLGKLLFPYPLMIIYPRWQIDAESVLSYLPLFAVIIVAFILWLKRESWPRAWFFAFTYFVVALLPGLGLINNTYSIYSYVADHFQYLASMGPLALAGAGIVRLADFVIPQRHWLQSTLGAGLVLVLGILSWQRAWVFQSEETLWTDALAKNANCWVGHINLGLVLVRNGQVDQGIDHFQKALEINPHAADAQNDLGFAFSRKGQVESALIHYQKALEIDPTYADPHNNLGNLYFRAGRVDQAIAEYQEAMKLNPNDADAHSNLGNVLFQKGALDAAISQYQTALAIRPDKAETHNNLGFALLRKGQLNEAVAQFQEALQLEPDYPTARTNLAQAQSLRQQGTSTGK